jgi:hypothetical protein
MFLFRLEKQVKDIVHKVFWDKLKEDLEATPPDYSHTLTLISEMKEVSYFLDLTLKQVFLH